MAMKPPSESPRRKQRRLTTGESVSNESTHYATFRMLLSLITGISSLLCSKIAYKKKITSAGQKHGVGRVRFGFIIPFPENISPVRHLECDCRPDRGSHHTLVSHHSL